MAVAKREQRKGTHHVSKSSRSLTSCVPKVQLRDPSLNVGVGAGALYILITCQEEMKMLNKTVEETENLVQELKHELLQHAEDLRSHHAHLAEDRSYLRQSSQADLDCMGQQPLPLSNSRLDEFLGEQAPAKRGMAKDQMAVLAAELEAELELMELNIKADESHDAGEVSSKGVSTSYYSDTSSHGMLEVSGIERPSAQSGISHVDYGVSPIELDHRLREVLEAQQEDRILELEQLLEETRAKLFVKEQEIICWKNHVHSLTNFLQPHSKVSKSSEDLLQSFQDPPLFTEVGYFNATSLSDLVADASTHKTKSPHSNEASMSASPFKNSKGVMSMVGESQCLLEGTGMDTAGYVFTKEIEAHTTGQNSEAFRSEVCTSFVNVEEDDAPSTLEISRQHCDNATPSDRSKLEISKLHDMSCRLASASPKEEVDMDSDVKYVVNCIMPKRIFLDKYHENFDGEDIQVPERSIKFNKKSLKLDTENWKESHGNQVDVTSPVLEKIRHYESLGGHAREKQT